LGTSKEQSIQIKYSSGLSDGEVEKMRGEAEQYSSEDHKRREVVETRNQADNLIYQTDKVLKEHSGRLGDAEKRAIEDAKKKLEETMKGDDAQAIRSAMDAYQTAAQALAKAMYEQAGAHAGAGPQPQAGPGAGPRQETAGPTTGTDDENIIDADFEVKQ
jgi:molecular chaperone DnaK